MSSSIFEERFHDGELIVQDKYDLTHCNPEVDSMFLTANTYYLLGKRFNPSPYFIGDIPRRYYKPGVRDGESGISRPYDNPNNMSRDNLTGMLVYLGWTEEWRLVRTLAKQILFRGSFFANTHDTTGIKKWPKALPDFAGPTTWGLLFRGMNLPTVLTYPILNVLDFYTLLATIYSVALSPAERTSTVYHTFTTLHWSKTKLPTVFSWLAYQTFIRCRKQVSGYPAKNGVISALKYYSRKPFDPPIYEIAERVFR